MDNLNDYGDWEVIQDGEHIVVGSSDFTHDVWLRVTGDFADGNKILYAQHIADRLNKTKPTD